MDDTDVKIDFKEEAVSNLFAAMETKDFERVVNV